MPKDYTSTRQTTSTAPSITNSLPPRIVYKTGFLTYEPALTPTNLKACLFSLLSVCLPTDTCQLRKTRPSLGTSPTSHQHPSSHTPHTHKSHLPLSLLSSAFFPTPTLSSLSLPSLFQIEKRNRTSEVISSMHLERKKMAFVRPSVLSLPLCRLHPQSCYTIAITAFIPLPLLHTYIPAANVYLCPYTHQRGAPSPTQNYEDANLVSSSPRPKPDHLCTGGLHFDSSNLHKL